VLDPALDLLPATDTFLCEFDTIKIRVLDQGIITKYLWSPTLGISDKNARNPFFFPIDTTQYILTVQNYCYNKADTIRIDVRKKPPIQLVKKDSICLYQTYQINAKGTGTFTWRPNKTLSTFNIANPIASPVQTTTYYVTLTDIYNCKNKDSLNLLVYPNPLVQIVTRPKYICLNIPYQIKVNADNSYKFIWKPGYGLNDSTVKEPIVVAQDTQRYIVQATNFHGCIDRDTIDLNVQKPVVPMAPSPVHICKNSFLFVEASGGFYYRWSPGYMINDTMNKRAQIYVDRDTVYKVYIANDCFIDSTNVQVIIDSLTDLQAATDTTIFRGSSVKLSVLGDGKEEWHPNYMIDDVFSKTPTVNPIYSTKYYVKSIGKNGCVSFDSVTVRVVGKTILLLPTGFSPNGDGVNDLFGIVQYLNIEKINSFDIYDRWGEKVFTTTDIKVKWDGSFNGEKMPIGTYVWYIDAQTYDGEKVQQKGNITLLR
jgi:gliding motility-associated-like protein